MKVDLDAIETRLATRYGEVVTVKADDVLAMAAELRTAREVIPVLRELADKIVGDAMAPWPLDEIVEKQAWPALAAYDRAVTP